MESVNGMRDARRIIESAGFTFDALRSYEPRAGLPGYAFSRESLGGAFYGHPKLEVRIAPLAVEVLDARGCRECSEPLESGDAYVVKSWQEGDAPAPLCVACASALGWFADGDVVRLKA